jgi:hypothetical protein
MPGRRAALRAALDRPGRPHRAPPHRGPRARRPPAAGWTSRRASRCAIGHIAAATSPARRSSSPSWRPPGPRPAPVQRPEPWPGDRVRYRKAGRHRPGPTRALPPTWRRPPPTRCTPQPRSEAACCEGRRLLRMGRPRPHGRIPAGSRLRQVARAAGRRPGAAAAPAPSGFMPQPGPLLPRPDLRLPVRDGDPAGRAVLPPVRTRPQAAR